MMLSILPFNQVRLLTSVPQESFKTALCHHRSQLWRTCLGLFVKYFIPNRRIHEVGKESALPLWQRFETQEVLPHCSRGYRECWLSRSCCRCGSHREYNLHDVG